MLTEHLDLTFSFTWIIVITNVIAVGICFLFIRQLVKITELRGSLVIPPVVILIFLGGYVESGSWFVMSITLAAGALGYLMERFDWPRPPLILGLVLGSLIERNMFTSYQAYGLEFLVRPLVLSILLVGVAVCLWTMIRGRRGGDPLDGQIVVSPLADFVGIIPIFGLIGWMIWQARKWPLDARMFPQTIGISVVVLGVLFVAITAYRARAATLQGVAIVTRDRQENRREITMALWCIGFAALISVLGFKIGGALSAALFMSLVARERAKMSLAFAAGIYLFFVITTDILKLASLDPGLLPSALGVSALDGFLIDPMIHAIFAH